MAFNRRKLREWVARRSLTPPVAKAFALWHVGRHAPSLVCQLPCEAADPTDRQHEIEQAVQDEVADHIEAWPGRQQYLVKAYDAAENEVGEFALSMIARDSRMDVSAELALRTPEQEAAVAMGHESCANSPAAMVMMQQMRHNESLVGRLYDLSVANSERDARLIALLTKKNEKLEDRRFEAVEMIEAMYCRRQERNLRQQKFDDDKNRKERLLSNLTTMVLPEIAKRVGLPANASRPTHVPTNGSNGANGSSGANGASGSSGANGAGAHREDPRVAAMREIFMKLPDQMQNDIVNALEPDDQHALLSIFRQAGADAAEERPHPSA